MKSRCASGDMVARKSAPSVTLSACGPYYRGACLARRSRSTREDTRVAGLPGHVSNAGFVWGRFENGGSVSISCPVNVGTR